ncbi:MAG: glutamine synthetase [Geminicoccaceae bacterium]
MRREPLIMACCSDLAGQVRGKAFPERDFDQRCASGIGWCPTNIQISAFDRIMETPFGALGDLLLKPDQDARVDVDLGPDDPGLHFVLCDITHTDGRPWECCLRTALRDALAALEADAGLRLIAAFEHEFHYTGDAGEPGGAYALRSMRRGTVLGEALVAVLDQAGIEVELFHPEYGAAQYEISIAPAQGLMAADQAVILRELARSVGERLGQRITFAPVVAGMGVGNGVHVHMSLVDAGGEPVMYDAAGPGGLSAQGGSFVAGIVRHLPALVALSAASTVSYQRLVPHRWSAAFTNLGLRDREAALRICPVREDDDIARSYNVEYRAADAAASPHLVLAALVRAGLQGLREGLPAPEPTEEDLALRTEAELAARGLRRLPTSLAQALDTFEADAVARSWWPPQLLDVYLKHKRGEVALLEGLSEEEQSERYAEVY